MVLGRIAMFSTLIALLVCAIFSIARIFGYIIRVRRIHLLSVDGLSYSSPACTISARRVAITFHIPRSMSPYWATLTASKYEYSDSECHASLEELQAKLWFFPVLFRFTAGPWITATMDDFRVRIFTSTKCPQWIQLLRNNIVYTVLNGETVRLHDMNTKLYLSAITAAKEGSEGEVDTPGLYVGEEQDEVRVRLAISQWHILNWHQRMYTFGDLQVELRRSWVEDRGSFVMIAKESRWTQLPAMHQDSYRKASTLWQILHGLYCFPSRIFKICRDPLSTLDIYVPRCDITFENFRVHDAQLFVQGAAKVKLEYDKYSARYPGILQEFAWDMFTSGVLSACQK